MMVTESVGIRIGAGCTGLGRMVVRYYCENVSRIKRELKKLISIPSPRLWTCLEITVEVSDNLKINITFLFACKK